MSTSVIEAIDRKKILLFISYFIVATYILRLIQLQLIQHEEYDSESAKNSIKQIENFPLRGVFFDRNKRLLVENTPTYTVRITPSDYKKQNSEYVEKLLDLEPGYIDKVLQKNKEYSRYVPIKIKRGVDFKVIGLIEENTDRLPGVDYIIEMQRGYPDSVMASHIFGYTKEINPTSLKEDNFYSPGDVIGYNGLEKNYEKDLRGVKGISFVRVDSKRREIGKFKDGKNDIPSVKGNDLVLGIDRDIQRIAETELKGRSGAVVAIEPETGEVLAIASAPDFDLNEFSYITPRAYLNQLYSDQLKPMFNRATMAAHPPGSTFKILCALIALEEGIITPETTLPCGGGFTYGKFFKCHGAHGATNVVRAIEKSCNTFFYQLIFKIGIDRLAAYAAKFNIGKKTGIDILEESNGLIPTSKYYEKIYGKNWPQGILVSLGIGQGEVSLTPLQLANFCALVANNGKSFVPHIAKGYLDENKNYHPFNFKPVETGISQRSFDIVKSGMLQVVMGTGTATNVKIPGIQIAGKTGTAQNPHGKDHSWFIGFAPYENPKIALCVLVENSGFGATYAAPIARKMFESYLKSYIDKSKVKPGNTAQSSQEEVQVED